MVGKIEDGKEGEKKEVRIRGIIKVFKKGKRRKRKRWNTGGGLEEKVRGRGREIEGEEKVRGRGREIKGEE